MSKAKTRLLVEWCRRSLERRWLPHASAGTRPGSGSLLILAALLAGVLWPGERILADAASGTFTGSASLRSNYYFERSTRVLSPVAALSLDTPTGVRVQGSYLLDAITSASLATGTTSDVAFTEHRNEVNAGLGYEFDLGASQLDLSLRSRWSKEPDYLSRGGGFSLAWSLNQRCTILTLSGDASEADVGAVLRSVPDIKTGKLIASKRVHKGDLEVLSTGFALDQVLSKSTTLTLGYDLSKLSGFQANAYRIVAFTGNSGGASPENHPNLRIRHAAYTWLAQYIPRTRSTIRVGYRVYRDSWDILAHSPEARFHQEIGRFFEVRLRYRYYTQSSSFFYDRNGYTNKDRYVTADPKMSAFRDQWLGGQVRLDLDFLAFTPLDALHTAVFDFNVDYILNTNRYGNGFVAQGGLTWGF